MYEKHTRKGEKETPQSARRNLDVHEVHPAGSVRNRGEEQVARDEEAHGQSRAEVRYDEIRQEDHCHAQDAPRKFCPRAIRELSPEIGSEPRKDEKKCKRGPNEVNHECGLNFANLGAQRRIHSHNHAEHQAGNHTYQDREKIMTLTFAHAVIASVATMTLV